MTDDQLALLRTICENPDLDAPRLVYADWLEEHGDHDRATFIRLQCELEHLDPFSLERLEAEQTEQRLLRKMGRRWIQRDALADFYDADALWLPQPRFRFRRGFIDYAELRSPGECLDVLPGLFARTPINGLRLGSPYTEAAAEQVWFDNTYFTVYLHSIGHVAHQPRQPSGTEFPRPDEFQRLLHSPLLAPIHSFTMDTLYSDGRHLEVLAASPLAGQLRHLDFSGNICVVPDDWAALTAAPALAGLQSLRLDRSRLSPGGLAALLNTPHLGNLRQLSMEGPERLPSLGPEGVQALCDSPHLPNLLALNLRGQHGGAEGLRALAAWPGLKNLTRLDVSYFYGDGEWDDLNRAWGEFARSANWGNLRELIVEGDCLERLEEILESPNIRTLRSLTFTNPFEHSDFDTAALPLPGFHSPTGWATESRQDDAAELLATCPNLADGLFLRMPDQGLSWKGRKRLRDRFGNRLELIAGDHCRPGDWMSGRSVVSE